MYIKTKLAVITTTLALATAISAPTQAAKLTEAQSKPVSTDTAPIKAVDTPSIDFSKIEVTTKAAEKPAPVIKEEVQEAAPVIPAKPLPEAPKATVATPQAQATPQPTQSPAASSKGAAIASAALAQIGVMQDCTMLATNSLKAVGINFHGWPVEYYSLGSAVSAAEAQPGDLIYYTYGVAGVPTSMAHIAVYIGNGQAVHGGWNGNQTIVFSANVGSGPQFIRVR